MMCNLLSHILKGLPLGYLFHETMKLISEMINTVTSDTLSLGLELLLLAS